MNNRIKLSLPGIVFGMAVLSCATFLPVDYGEASNRIVELINNGDAESLGAFSQVPFVLDDEIIVLKEDVMTFWRTIVDNGLRVQMHGDAEVQPIDENIQRYFQDTMDMRIYFKKLPEGVVLVKFDTGRGDLLLLLGELRMGAPGIPVIWGLKGLI